MYRTITFPSPLFANSFITGAYVGKVKTADASHPRANPGLVISTHHRAAGDSGGTITTDHHQASLGNTASPGGDEAGKGWEIVPFRAVTDRVGGPREITAVTFSIGIFANNSSGNPPSPRVGGADEDMRSGDATVIFDQIYFDIQHPFLRMDREGSILGAYIAYAQIENAHIQDATIEHAKIGTVNASSISTGTLYAGGLYQNVDSQKTGVGTSPSTASIVIDGPAGRITIRDDN